MAIGLLGKKLGMTHVYDPVGGRIAVTAIQVGPCTVVDVKTQERNGYQAVKLGWEPVKESRLPKPEAGAFKKAGLGSFRHLREFRVDSVAEYEPGKELTVGLFQDNELVDVTGITIGRGFQGGIKRWGWSGGPETHGSMSHRRTGANGTGTTPGRVLRGHRFPGHMGNVRKTVQNVRIVRTDAENNILLILGSVPGAENSLVLIRKSVKKPGFIKKLRTVDTELEEEAAAAKKAARGKKKQ
jgi:large subunit ribosomal protein L3